MPWPWHLQGGRRGWREQGKELKQVELTLYMAHVRKAQKEATRHRMGKVGLLLELGLHAHASGNPNCCLLL